MIILMKTTVVATKPVTGLSDLVVLFSLIHEILLEDFFITYLSLCGIICMWY
jgi:hypothetical protein